MTKSRCGMALVCAATLVGAGIATAQVPETAEGIPNYKVVGPGLATAGQPSPEALQKLKEQGFKTVINLRTEAEGGGTGPEKAAVEAQGLRYVGVPISSASFSIEDVQAVAKVLDDVKTAPVLLHCASANRVGAVWAVMQVQKGRSLEQAEAEGREIGLSGAAMIEAMKRVAGQAAAQR